MRLSDLQNKDVVELKTGQRLGNVIDIEINDSTGSIIKIIVYDRKGFISMIRGTDEIEILWDQIKKIGSDVILVSKN